MTPTEVLKMLKRKIDTAGLNKCNYAIETSDIEAISQALLLYDVVGRSEQLGCPKCNGDMTGDGSKSWCKNKNCDFVEAD